LPAAFAGALSGAPEGALKSRAIPAMGERVALSERTCALIMPRWLEQIVHAVIIGDASRRDKGIAR